MLRAINEQNIIDVVTDRKRKAQEKNQKPKPAKMFHDFVKDGHFSNI